MSSNDVPGELTSATAVPSVGLAGGTLPTARRMVTPAKSLSGGFDQVRCTALFADVAARFVTAPGGVESSGITSFSVLRVVVERPWIVIGVAPSSLARWRY